ncbi:hypothetical protein ACMFMG_008060 [Clarireedia jacksonii]
MQQCQHHRSLQHDRPLQHQFEHHKLFYEDNALHLLDDDLGMDFDLGHWQPFGILSVAGSPAKPINSAITDEVFMDACRNFLNRRFSDTTQQPINGPELETILLNPQQVQNWLTKKYTNYLERLRIAQEATMQKATTEQEDSNLLEEKYNGGGLMEMLQMDLDTDGPPSDYREFDEKMTKEELNNERSEKAMLNQLLKDLFPKLCVIVPAEDTLPIVRFFPAQLRRDILMASQLREPMMSLEELCRVWDEWTITQLPKANHAVTKVVPSLHPEPLQPSTFSRKRIKFTIASYNEHEKSTKYSKTSQTSTLVSSITPVPSSTSAKGQKLRSTMRKETTQPVFQPTQTRPIPFTSPTRGSSWSWGEPKTDGSSDPDRERSSRRVATPVDQNRAQHYIGGLGSNNYQQASHSNQTPITMDRPFENIHPERGGAWNSHNHETTAGFQQIQYPFGNHMPPPWNAGGRPTGPMIGNIEPLGMSRFAQNPLPPHGSSSPHPSISGNGTHQIHSIQPSGRYERIARGSGLRDSPRGQRLRERRSKNGDRHLHTSITIPPLP